MAEGDLGSQVGGEPDAAAAAAAAGADEAGSNTQRPLLPKDLDDRILRPIPPSSADEESQDFQLPLLQGSGSEKDAALEPDEAGRLVLPKKQSSSCGGDGPIPQLEGSLECSSADLESQLPLLQESGLEKGAALEPDEQSNSQQRRSTESPEANGDWTKSIPLDIETGDAMLESLKQSPPPCITISPALVMKTLLYIMLWYAFSTCLTLYNKTLLGDHMGKFPAPMLMNAVHFSMQAILSKAIIWFQSSRDSESSTITKKMMSMSWRDYFTRVVPTALATALEINLSNASLVFISVTFATMCKSASPIFLLLFAFAFRLERPSFRLLGNMLIISIGVLLTVAKETEFDFWGFAFVMLAAVMSGFRWTMTQILLQKKSYGLQNPITLMSYVTPVMAVATALLSLAMDPWKTFTASTYFDSSKHILGSCLLMFLGGALAFCMVLTEYILVSATSAVTVTIAGIVKEAVTILVAVYYFHDQFTVLKGAGLFTIMVGIGLFNWYKYLKLKEGQSNET